MEILLVWLPWKIQCVRVINYGVLSTFSMDIRKAGLRLVPGLQVNVNEVLCSFF